MADKKTFSIQIDGIKQSVDGVESSGGAVNKNVTSIKDLKQALKATKDEMAGLDKYSDEWNALAKQVNTRMQSMISTKQLGDLLVTPRHLMML